jgi:hypothetical protein
MANMADAPGGRSLAFTVRSHQLTIGKVKRASGPPSRGGRQGFQLQRVYIGLEEFGNGCIHKPVPRHRGEAAKRLGHDMHLEVALTGRGACMPCVQVALVLDGKPQGREALLQELPQPLFAQRPLHRQGGLVSAAWTRPLIHRTCGIMKISIATVMPNTLNFTQTPSAKFCAM